MARSLKEMRPMEKHRYLTQNKQICPSCLKEKSLRTFFDKDTNKVNNHCNACVKKIKKQELNQMVFDILSDMDLY